MWLRVMQGMRRGIGGDMRRLSEDASTGWLAASPQCLRSARDSRTILYEQSAAALMDRARRIRRVPGRLRARLHARDAAVFCISRGSEAGHDRENEHDCKDYFHCGPPRVEP
jgi:hypothetical protein